MQRDNRRIYTRPQTAVSRNPPTFLTKSGLARLFAEEIAGFPRTLVPSIFTWEHEREFSTRRKGYDLCQQKLIVLQVILTRLLTTLQWQQMKIQEQLPAAFSGNCRTAKRPAVNCLKHAMYLLSISTMGDKTIFNCKMIANCHR